jgi:BirA family biotin operon repressor/biotin-[acetyl-CoA-carboxylase] ligase
MSPMLRVHYDTVGSTNDRALALGALNRDAPVLVTASVQTIGRGRAGRPWHSPRGGAWFSLAWPGGACEARAGATPLVAGLAVCRALAAWLDADQRAGLQLKWPNDVLLHDQKLAGILCERPIRPMQGPCGGETPKVGSMPLVIGAGINANLAPERLAGDVHRRATSLQEALGQPVDRHVLINRAADEIAAAMRRLDHNGLDEATRDAIDAQLAWRGQSVLIQQGPHQTEGRLLGINESGGLMIETATGRATFHAGELVSLHQPCAAP